MHMFSSKYLHESILEYSVHLISDSEVLTSKKNCQFAQIQNLYFQRTS